MKGIFSITLILVLVGTQSLQAQTSAAASAQAVEFREKVEKWGVGKKVSVKMSDGNAYKGRITRIAANEFGVADETSGREISADYSGVQSLKTPFPKVFKVLLIVGGILVVAAAACSLSKNKCSS